MNKKLISFRSQINSLDKSIVRLLSRRFVMAKKIGIIKQKNKINIRDKPRENEVLTNVKNFAKTLSIDEKFITKIYQQILLESKKLQL